LKELLDDEEETLIALAKSLYDITKYIGSADIVKLVLPSYESLFSSEDTSVRCAAMEYTEKLVSDYGLKDEEINNMVKRLAGSDNYAARISAIMIYCKMGNLFSSSRCKEIMGFLSTCSNSEIPIVRKTVAMYIKHILKVVPKLENDGLNI